MFNAQDLKNLQAFLNRVDLKGGEAMAMAELQIKTANALQAATNPPPADPPSIDPPADPPRLPIDPPEGGKQKDKH